MLSEEKPDTRFRAGLFKGSTADSRLTYSLNYHVSSEEIFVALFWTARTNSGRKASELRLPGPERIPNCLSFLFPVRQMGIFHLLAGPEGRIRKRSRPISTIADLLERAGTVSDEQVLDWARGERKQRVLLRVHPESQLHLK